MKANELKVDFKLDQKIFDILIKEIKANRGGLENLNEKFDTLNAFIRRIEDEIIELKLKNEVKGNG